MYARRVARLPRVTTLPWQPAYAPGMHDGFFATERELRDLTTGAVIGPNGGPAELCTGTTRWPGASRPTTRRRVRPTRAVKGSDDDFLETYLRRGNITGLRERQARQVWHLFKTVVNKPLKTCTRKDGEALVAHMEEPEAGGKDKIKSATLRRRLVPLVATVNLAIEDGELTFNPFSSVVPNRDDEDERDAFTEDDMALMRANLHKLDKNDELLVRLLATSGMRRGKRLKSTARK